MSNEADDIKLNLESALEAVGMKSTAKILRSFGMDSHEEDLYKGIGIQILLKCRTEPDYTYVRDGGCKYSFNISDKHYRLFRSSHLSPSETTLDSYILFACNDAGENLPVALYLIPADFITGDNIRKYQDSNGQHKFHLKVSADYDSAVLLEEDKLPKSVSEKSIHSRQAGHILVKF